MVLIDRKIPDFACDVVGLDNAGPPPPPPNIWWKRIRGHPVSQRTAGLGEYPSRAPERLSRHACPPPRRGGRNAEVQLNDGAMLDNVLRQFHARHRGMRKAVISANGALTLQVARALKRVGLIWGAISACWASTNWSGRSWPASELPPSNSRRGRSATRRSNRLFGALPALTTPSANGYFPASLSSADQPPLTILRDADHKLNISPFLMEPIPSSVLRRLSNKRRE